MLNMGVEITSDSENRNIQVKGELTSKTVMDALSKFRGEVKNLSAWVIDFSAVSKVDSTAIALLIELKRDAQKESKSISFISLPSTLLAIARLSQVEGLLGEKA
jgi:phospholipid transport system transporter-binding protein